RPLRLGKGEREALTIGYRDGRSRVAPVPPARQSGETNMSKSDEQPPRVNDERDEVVIPVVEEEVVAGARPVKTGAVRVDKHVERRIRRIDTPLLHEDVDVRHVAINRVVTEMPAVRRKGDTVIVPVVEEELVVTK